ncbi:hypothetical protein [Aliiroseovarius crassostreae]|uniref:hypothetical protein n=1 Tax=Aliiroseovarius crassostreae TaxID=154981 RepID=UPI003C7D198A
MRKHVGLVIVTVSMAALTACVDTRIPDSAAHLPNKPVDTTVPLSAMVEGSTVSTQPLQNGAVVALSADGTSAAPTPTSPAPNSTGISDEQDFQAVAARESIESDAARIASNRAQYEQVQPTAVPDRPKGAGVSIVDYALSTTNTVGESQYKRFSLGGQKRFDRNCASYGSPDIAQEAFLNAGGPQRDRYGIDPDGDGFACGWNPAPFRNVRAAPTPVPSSTGAVSAADLAAAGITGTPEAPATAPAVPPAPLPGEALNISSE